MLKRQVRRARLERDAAVEASEGYRKKERLYALREKQAELALSRVQTAEKEHSQQEKLLAHKGKALMQAQSELADSRSKCSRFYFAYLLHHHAFVCWNPYLSTLRDALQGHQSGDVCRMEAQLEEFRNRTAGQELELQTIRKQLQEKHPRSPFRDATVLDALPQLPHSSVTVSANILPLKHTKASNMQCLLHLSQKLKQDVSLTGPTQKLVDKLVLAAQSASKEESVRKQREDMLVTFVRDQHSSLKQAR